MATSGKVETGTLKHSKFYVNWQVGDTNIPENYHTINWQVGLNCGTSSGWDSWYTNAIKINSLSINGQTVMSGNTYSNISGAGDHQLASGSIKVVHNSDGSKEFNISISGWLYSYGNTTGSQNFTLDNIPRASKINSFLGTDIDGDFSVNYTSYYYGYTNKLRLSIPNVIALETFNYSSGTSFKLNNYSITYLYNYMQNKTEVNIGAVIETWNGSTKIGESEELINVCKITNCNPEAGTFTYKDNKQSTVNITENNQRIIRNNSELLFTIGNATAKKGANISKYQVTIGSTTKEITTAGTINWGVLNLSSNTTATLKVIDSRGNIATKDVTIIIDDWELPTGIITLNRKNNFYSDTYIKVDANYSNLNNKNTILIKYRYKKTTTSTYSSYIVLSDNVQSTITLDNNYQWDIQVVIIDRIGTTTYNLFIDRGTPIMFYDRKRSSAGANGFPTHDNSFEVFGDFYINGKMLLDLIFPIGSTYITQENINPNTILGFGTWERLKGKVCLGLDENDTDFSEIGNTGGTKKHKHTTSILGGNYIFNKAGCHYINASDVDGVASSNYESSEVSNMPPYEVVGYMWIRRK